MGGKPAGARRFRNIHDVERFRTATHPAQLFSEHEPRPKRPQRIARRPRRGQTDGYVTLQRCQVADSQMREPGGAGGFGEKRRGRERLGASNRFGGRSDGAGEVEATDRDSRPDRMKPDDGWFVERRLPARGKNGFCLGILSAPEAAPCQRQRGGTRGWIVRPAGEDQGGPEHTLGFVQPSQIDPRDAGQRGERDRRSLVWQSLAVFAGRVECRFGLARPASLEERRAEGQRPGGRARPVGAPGKTANRLAQRPIARRVAPGRQLPQRDLHALAEAAQIVWGRPSRAAEWCGHAAAVQGWHRDRRTQERARLPWADGRRSRLPGS